MYPTVGVPEWLSGMTRNHVGSARAGSNPAAHVLANYFVFLIYLLFFFLFYLIILLFCFSYFYLFFYQAHAF